MGRRVWVWGAQSYRPFGTAAEYTVVPTDLAVDLPETVSDDIGACIGIPGITAHRAVYADGPVRDQTVLVQGVQGSVGSLAAQLARHGGARVIGTVRRSDQVARVDPALADQVVDLDPDPAATIRDRAPEGVDRVVEVAFSDNVELDAQVLRNGGVLAAYASRADRPAIPFWPMLFANHVIRLLGSDDFPHQAKLDATRELTRVADQLVIPRAPVMPRGDIARAHDLVDAGGGGRVVLDVTA